MRFRKHTILVLTALLSPCWPSSQHSDFDMRCKGSLMTFCKLSTVRLFFEIFNIFLHYASAIVCGLRNAFTFSHSIFSVLTYAWGHLPSDIGSKDMVCFLGTIMLYIPPSFLVHNFYIYSIMFLLASAGSWVLSYWASCKPCLFMHLFVCFESNSLYCPCLRRPWSPA